MPGTATRAVRTRRRAQTLALAGAALWAATCGTTQPSHPAAAVTGIPTSINDEWPLWGVAPEGIAPGRLSALSASVAAGQYGQVDALVIVRNGKLCFDGYYRGSPSDLHE